MYEIVVNVSTIPIITSKVAEALPFAILAAATKTIVEITPERKLTLTGVPSFAEKRAEDARPGAVVAGHGLAAVGAHQPRAGARDESEDEPDRRRSSSSRSAAPP